MQSKIFKFQLSREESIQYLEDTKKDEREFVNAVAMGEKIKKLVNEDDIEGLKNYVNTIHPPMIPKIQIFLQEAFEQAVLYRYEEIMMYFLDNGYSLEDSKHLIPLVHTARFLSNDPPVEALQMLIDHGADIEETDNETYRTPLHWSCKFGVQKFIEILVKQGADINSVDKKKRTPLFYLEKAMKKKPQLSEQKKFLIENGAKLTYQDELPQY